MNPVYQNIQYEGILYVSNRINAVKVGKSEADDISRPDQDMSKCCVIWHCSHIRAIENLILGHLEAIGYNVCKGNEWFDGRYNEVLSVVRDKLKDIQCDPCYENVFIEEYTHFHVLELKNNFRCYKSDKGYSRKGNKRQIKMVDDELYFINQGRLEKISYEQLVTNDTAIIFACFMSLLEQNKVYDVADPSFDELIEIAKRDICVGKVPPKIRKLMINYRDTSKNIGDIVCEKLLANGFIKCGSLSIPYTMESDVMVIDTIGTKDDYYEYRGVVIDDHFVLSDN